MRSASNPEGTGSSAIGIRPNPGIGKTSNVSSDDAGEFSIRNILWRVESVSQHDDSEKQHGTRGPDSVWWMQGLHFECVTATALNYDRTDCCDCTYCADFAVLLNDVGRSGEGVKTKNRRERHRSLRPVTTSRLGLRPHAINRTYPQPEDRRRDRRSGSCRSRRGGR